MTNPKSRTGVSKFIIYTGGLVGLGLIGSFLYNKKVRNKKMSSLDKHFITEELRTFFNADFSFNTILLNKDYEKLKSGNVESAFELESIMYALDLYYTSRNFKTPEIRDLIQAWYLNNIKIIDSYLGKRDMKEVIKGIGRLDLATEKLEKLINRSGLYNDLGEDNDIQESIIGTFIIFQNALDESNELASYITNLNSENKK